MSFDEAIKVKTGVNDRTIWLNPQSDGNAECWLSIGEEAGVASMGYAFLSKKRARDLAYALLYVSTVLDDDS